MPWPARSKVGPCATRTNGPTPMPCWPWCAVRKRRNGADSCGSSSVWPRAWARPMPCSKRPASKWPKASPPWSAWSRPTAVRTPKPCSTAWTCCPVSVSTTGGMCWRNSTSTPPLRPARPLSSWTNWLTPTPRAAAIPNAGRTWRNSSNTASTSGPRSTSSTWRA